MIQVPTKDTTYRGSCKYEDVCPYSVLCTHRSRAAHVRQTSGSVRADKWRTLPAPSPRPRPSFAVPFPLPEGFDFVRARVAILGVVVNQKPGAAVGFPEVRLHQRVRDRQGIRHMLAERFDLSPRSPATVTS